MQRILVFTLLGVGVFAVVMSSPCCAAESESFEGLVAEVRSVVMQRRKDVARAVHQSPIEQRHRDDLAKAGRALDALSALQDRYEQAQARVDELSEGVAVKVALMQEDHLEKMNALTAGNRETQQHYQDEVNYLRAEIGVLEKRNAELTRENVTLRSELLRVTHSDSPQISAPSSLVP